MELFVEKYIKLSFSGHDSFQCRQFWLKKGFDFVLNGHSFGHDDAVVNLGVGKNMVSSIRYWLKAFNITDNRDEITNFGRLLLADDGYDPFLEDEGSLWLLHYHLVKSNVASIYQLIFNDLRREKIEFSKESFLLFMRRKTEGNKLLNFNPKTMADDFDVFRKMYLPALSEKSNEDGYSGLLAELQLILRVENRFENKREELFHIENAERDNLPVEIFVYALLDNHHWGNAISLASLEQEINSPGAIFAINKAGLIEKIQEAQARYPWLHYVDHAGVKELQLREKPDPLTLLQQYYANE
jgi:hypothetical protein